MVLQLRQPAVAGQFYPASQSELQAMLSDFFAQLEERKENYLPRIIIVPHAGYVFSGKVAAYAYQIVRQFDFDNVIILGVSHYYPFVGVALSGAIEWSTPLGRVKVDSKTNKYLLGDRDKVFINDDIHSPEHSLEVQLPFLQYCLQDFTITPLLLGGDHQPTIHFLSNKLINLLNDPRILLVVSSDLSHYPDYQTARMADAKLLTAITQGKIEEFVFTYRQLEQEFPNVDTFACGASAILTALHITEQVGLTGKLLHYANSGDALWGDKERVVGYGAVVFYQN